MATSNQGPCACCGTICTCLSRWPAIWMTVGSAAWYQELPHEFLQTVDGQAFAGNVTGPITINNACNPPTLTNPYTSFTADDDSMIRPIRLPAGTTLGGDVQAIRGQTWPPSNGQDAYENHSRYTRADCNGENPGSCFMLVNMLDPAFIRPTEPGDPWYSAGRCRYPYFPNVQYNIWAAGTSCGGGGATGQPGYEAGRNEPSLAEWWGSMFGTRVAPSGSDGSDDDGEVVGWPYPDEVERDEEGNPTGGGDNPACYIAVQCFPRARDPLYPTTQLDPDRFGCTLMTYLQTLRNQIRADEGAWRNPSETEISDYLTAVQTTGINPDVYGNFYFGIWWQPCGQCGLAYATDPPCNDAYHPSSPCDSKTSADRLADQQVGAGVMIPTGFLVRCKRAAGCCTFDVWMCSGSAGGSLSGNFVTDNRVPTFAAFNRPGEWDTDDHGASMGRCFFHQQQVAKSAIAGHGTARIDNCDYPVPVMSDLFNVPAGDLSVTDPLDANACNDQDTLHVNIYMERAEYGYLYSGLPFGREITVLDQRQSPYIPQAPDPSHTISYDKATSEVLGTDRYRYGGTPIFNPGSGELEGYVANSTEDYDRHANFMLTITNYNPCDDG